MVSTKVLKAIENDLLEEKKNTLDQLKEFLQEKIGGDTDQICDFIDEFANEHLSTASIKKTKAKKEKKAKGKKRPPSYYNHYMQKALADIKESEKKKTDDEDKIPKGERMAYASKGWNAYKETPNFEAEKKAWEAKRDEEWNSASDTDSIGSKSSKGSEKEASEKDEETDTEIEVVKKPKKDNKKDNKKSKKDKEKEKKAKKEKKKEKHLSDEDSDDVSDNSDDGMDSKGSVLQIINADSDDENDSD